MADLLFLPGTLLSPSGAPIANARVQVVEGPARKRVVAAETTSSRDGRFRLRLGEYNPSGKGFQTLRVLDGDTELPQTKAIRWRKGHPPASVEVRAIRPKPVPTSQNPFSDTPSTPHGVVRHTDGTPLNGVRVRLYAVKPGTESQWRREHPRLGEP